LCKGTVYEPLDLPFITIGRIATCQQRTFRVLPDAAPLKLATSTGQGWRSITFRVLPDAAPLKLLGHKAHKTISKRSPYLE